MLVQITHSLLEGIMTTPSGKSAETFSKPDDGTRPFRSEKNTNWEGGCRVPCVLRWPGVVKPATEIKRADNEAGGYDRWFINHVFVIMPAQAFVAQHLATSKEFPPRQKPGVSTWRAGEGAGSRERGTKSLSSLPLFCRASQEFASC
jgi:hypothetical protein